MCDMEKENRYVKIHKAYKEKSKEALSTILQGLDEIKFMCNHDDYGYSKTEISALFRKIDLGVKSAKAHYLLNGQNIALYSSTLRHKNDVIRCLETNEFFTSIRRASLVTGVNGGNLGRVLSGHLPEACGYSWEYFDLSLAVTPLSFKKKIKDKKIIDIESGKEYQSAREVCTKFQLPEKLVYMCLFVNSRVKPTEYMSIDGCCFKEEEDV